MNRPPALVCYICGRQFGTKSLAFHLKACEKKWENEENLKPSKQRRPCPQPPPGLAAILGKETVTKSDINQFNMKSFDSYVEQALVECEYCGRRFNPKSLIPHQKACKTNPMIKKTFVNKGPLGKSSEPEMPIKPAQGSYNFKAQMGKVESSSDLVPCRRCGRTFMPDRVGKHERVCKADPVEISKPPPKIEKKPQPSRMKPNFGKQKKAKWKIQHEQFQNALKAMRQIKAIQAKGGKLSDLPPPPPSNYDHYIQCRHCGRKYAPDVAQRHIPKCANIINKPGGIKPSKIQEKYIGGTGSGANKSGISGSSSYGMPGKPSVSPMKPSYGMGGYGGNSINSKPFAGSTSSNAYGYKQEIKSYPSKNSNMSYEQNKGYGYGNSYQNSYQPVVSNIKGTSNQKQTKAPESSYQMASSSFKPVMKTSSKTNANKYW